MMKEWKKQLVLLVSGMCIGVTVLMLSSQLHDGMLSLINMQNLIQVSFQGLEYKKYIGYLARKRGGILIFIWLIGMTSFSEILLNAFVMFFGIGTGSVILLMLEQYKGKGFLVLTGIFMPQMLLYIPAYSKWISLWKNDKVDKKYGYGDRRKRRQVIDKLSKILMVILVTIIGLLTECYVNSNLLKIIVKNM